MIISVVLGVVVAFAALVAVLVRNAKVRKKRVIAVGQQLGLSPSKNVPLRRVRGSGQGFSYNMGRGVGALFPTLVGFLSSTMSLGHAIAVFAMVAYPVFIFCNFAVAGNTWQRVAGI